MIETQDIANCVLIQNATLADIEKMICRAVDARMAAFYQSIREKPETMIHRADAADKLHISKVTLDKYAKFGLLHPKHVGGRIWYSLTEIENFCNSNQK